MTCNCTSVNLEGRSYKNDSAKNQRNKDCIYAARQGMMAYNSNTMGNSSLHLLLVRSYAKYYPLSYCNNMELRKVLSPVLLQYGVTQSIIPCLTAIWSYAKYYPLSYCNMELRKVLSPVLLQYGVTQSIIPCLTAIVTPYQ